MDIERREMKTINISERNKLKENDDGSYTLECHCKPIHYLVSGEWQDIKTEIKLYSGQYLNLQNKVTVGLRNDLNTYKYMGMRYDKDTQLEFSLESVKFDDVEVLQNKTFKEIQDPVFNGGYYEIKEIGDITLIHNIGDNGVKTWFKINDKLGKFEILLKVHIKGFKVLNEKVDNEYVPDKYGRFNFGFDDNALYWINLPQGKDSNDNIIRNINHRLFEQNGELYYLKELESSDLLNMEYPIFIDASTYYSQTGDGRVVLGFSNWDEFWAASNGTYVVTNEIESNEAIGFLKTIPYTMIRSFFYFDTTDIPTYSNIQSSTFNFYKISFNLNTNGILVEGTQGDTLSIEDFWKWVSGSNFLIWGSVLKQEEWLSGTLPSNLLNHIEKRGITKFALINDLEDHMVKGNIFTYPISATSLGIRYSDYSGTDYDPYLSITYTIPPTKNASSDVLIQSKDRKLILY